MRASLDAPSCRRLLVVAALAAPAFMACSESGVASGRADSSTTDDAPTDDLAPAVAIVAPGPGARLRVGDSLQVRATATDDRTAPESLAWRWSSTQGGLLGAGTGVDGELTRSVVLIHPGRDTLTLEVTDLAGHVGSASVTIEIDGPPSAPEVRIDPADPDTDDVLTAVVTRPGTDPNDDPLTYDYQWFKDGVAALAGPSVPPSATARGELWRVAVQADDGGATSAPVTAEVLIGNARAACAAALLLPAAGETDTAFHCDCPDRRDADPADADLDHCRFYAGDLLIAEADAVDGRCALDPALTERGQALHCVYEPGDETERGDPVTSGTVTVANARPPAPLVTLAPSTATVATELHCAATASADDADGDPQSFVYAWVVDGAEGPAGTSDTATPARLGAARGARVACRVYADDGLGRSTYGESNTVRVDNAAPEGGAVIQSPVDPREGGVITCSAAGAVDPDGDPVAWRYAWTVDDAPVPGQTEPTLTSDFFDKGDVVRCVATPTDGASDGAPVASKNSATARNTPPTLASVGLAPASPAPRTGPFTCVFDGLADVDPADTALTVTYAWIIIAPSGAETPLVLEHGATLTPTGLRPTDRLACEVTPHDPDAAGLPVRSAVVTLANRAPVVAQVTLGPTPATARSLLTCQASGVTDPDGDPTTLVYRWTHQGQTVVGATSDTLAGPFLKGDSYRCYAAAHDGFATGAEVASATVVIQNSLPAISAVTLTPDLAAPCDRFTCQATVSDADQGDTVVLTYRWTADDLTLGATGATLDADRVALGALVTCHVTAFDGTLGAGGAPVTSPEVASPTATVENLRPTLDFVDLGPLDADVGQVLTCTPQGFADADCQSAATYAYRWFVGATLVAGAAGPTLATAALHAGDVVTCQVVPSDGLDEGAAHLSNPVVLAAELPPAPVVAVSAPDGPYGVIRCVLVGPPIGDEGYTYSYSWSLGAEPFEAGSARFFEQAHHCDRLRCRAVASNGTVSLPSNVAELILPVGADCDDYNPCTDEACGAHGGCLNPANTADCEDGDLCNGHETCVSGQCQPGQATVCAGASACGEENLALASRGATAVASSEHSAGLWPASRAIDGALATEWVGAYCPGCDTNTLTVALAEPSTLTRFEADAPDVERDIVAWKLEAETAAGAWLPIATATPTAPRPGAIAATFAPVTTRRVRFTLTAHDQAYDQTVLYELALWGTPVACAAGCDAPGWNVASLSAGTTVTATGEHGSGDYPPEQALDGDPATGWVGPYCYGCSPQALTIELPAPRRLASFALHGEGGSDDPTTDVALEVEDASGWRPLDVSFTSTTPGELAGTFPAVVARRVRVTVGTPIIGDPVQVVVYDLELFGTASACAVGCFEPTCNPATGACDLPRPDGESCADDDLCNGVELCAGGVCQPGAATDCAGVADACLEAECNPATGACDLPKDDGTACADGDLCNGDDACASGVCGPTGAPVDCSGVTDLCLEASCNPATGACDLAKPDGTICGPAEVCADADRCQAGVCEAGATNDCGPTVVWRVEDGLVLTGYPAVGDDGAIYSSTYANAGVAAVNPDGSARWSGRQAGCNGFPAYDVSVGANGLVFALGDWNSCGDGRMHAFDADGATAWTHGDCGGSPHPRHIPAVDDDHGVVYLGSSTVCAIDADDGHDVWSRPAGRYIGQMGMALDSADNLHKGSTDGTTHLTSKAWDGTARYDQDFSGWNGPRITSVVTEGGEDRVVGVYSGDASYVTVRTIDGAEAWRSTLVDSELVQDGDGDLYGSKARPAPLPPMIVSLRDDGDARWHVPLPDDETFAAVEFVTDDGQLFVRGLRRVYALAASDGHELWRKDFDADIVAGLVLLRSGDLLVSDRDGRTLLDTDLDYAASGWPKVHANRRNTARAGDDVPLRKPCVDAPPVPDRPITITNASASDGVDYPVRVVIDTAALIAAGELRADGGDLRFVDADGATPLSYWVESGLGTAATVVWVKVPALAAGADHVIHLRYASPALTSLSDASSVFLLDEPGDSDSGWSLDPTGANNCAGGNRFAVVGSGADAYLELVCQGFQGYDWKSVKVQKPLPRELTSGAYQLDYEVRNRGGNCGGDDVSLAGDHGLDVNVRSYVYCNGFSRNVFHFAGADSGDQLALVSDLGGAFTPMRVRLDLDLRQATLVTGGVEQGTITGTLAPRLDRVTLIAAGWNATDETIQLRNLRLRPVLTPEPTAVVGDATVFIGEVCPSAYAHALVVTVDNSGAEALGDYPVRVDLDAATFPFAEARADGADVLPVSADGRALLEHYLASWDAGAETATLWVRVPHIPAAGTTTFRLYYGNALASSLSTRHGRWELWDDFEGSTVGPAWDVLHIDDEHHGFAGSTTVAGGMLVISGGQHHITDGVRSHDALALQGGGLRVEMLGWRRYDSSFCYAAPQLGLARGPAVGEQSIAYTNQGDTYWGHYQQFGPDLVEGGAVRTGSDTLVLTYTPTVATLTIDGALTNTVTTGLPVADGPFHLELMIANPYQTTTTVEVDHLEVTRFATPEPTTHVGP